MWKKKTFMAGGISLLVVLLGVGGLIFIVKYEPRFYVNAQLAPGRDRQILSGVCVGRLGELLNHWKDGRGPWGVEFTQGHINSYFEEDFLTSQKMGSILEEHGISDPRIVLENDRMRVAFRYGSPPWSTIISYDLKLWVAPKDVNAFCLEILGRHAGGLPIATQSVLNDISELASHKGFDVTWYRHDGNPVALIRIQEKDGPQSPARLLRLALKEGMLAIGGISQEPTFTGDAKKTLAPLGN